MIQETRQMYMSHVAVEKKLEYVWAQETLIYHVSMTFRRKTGRKRIAGPEI